MNEKKNLNLLNENDLSAVSGGCMFDDRRNAKYSVGQMVRFYYTAGASKETLVSYCWSGKIIEILQETEGIFYKAELDEQAKQIVGYSYLELFLTVSLMFNYLEPTCKSCNRCDCSF